MLADDIIEVCNSSYLNPLAIVMREGKPPRICVDARRINKITMPDRARVQPIQELLQRFHGAYYITSIDLTSAFLQVELKPESRQHMAFLFESQEYQFKRTLYGFRKSLSVFIRALQLTLGSDTCGFALSYVDDILVFTSSFQLRLEHLNMVIGRLTAAGFTVNIKKCHFCRTEIAFLGYLISRGCVTPDPWRMEAISCHPEPKNQT
jgi:hypothetical protein